jgi:hypothetical protein
MTLRLQAARWISILGHPFVLIPLLVAAVTARWMPPERVALIVGIVLLVSVVPMLLLMSRRVRSGAWTNYDVSVREQRRGMFPMAMAIAGGTTLVLLAVGTPRPVMHGVVASLVLIVIAAVVNLWLKISLHMAFAVFTAVSLVSLGWWMTAVGLLLALAIAWSRLELERHTMAEVVGGALLGAMVGVGLVVL